MTPRHIIKTLVATALITLPAQAAWAVDHHFKVTDANDSPDQHPGDCICAAVRTTRLGIHPCTLRAAIQEANACGGTDSTVHNYIDLAITSATLAIAGPNEDAAATGDLDITRSVVINGGGATIDGGRIDRVFDVRAGAVTINDLTITGGYASSDAGGGVRVASALTLSNTSVDSNEAKGGGGAVVVLHGASLTVVNPEAGDPAHMYHNVDSSTACAGGGAILNRGGTVSVDRLWAGGNTSQCGPGGVMRSNVDCTGGTCLQPHVTIDEAYFTDNSAATGGAISQGALGTLDLSNSEIDSNTATTDGGALDATGSELNLVGNEMFWNHATRNGGALHLPASSGRVYITGLTTGGNSAGFNGGDLWVGQSATTCVDCILDGASAGSSGGAVKVDAPPSALDFEDGSITDSEAVAGGAIAVNGSAFFYNTVISDNTATGLGGGAAIDTASTVSFAECAFYGNQSSGAGGGLGLETGTTSVYDTTFGANVSHGYGGAIYVNPAANLTAQRVTITANSSTLAGTTGGIYAGGASTLGTSILGGNSSGGHDCSGTLTSTGYNLVQDVATCNYVSATTDRVGPPNVGALTHVGSTWVYPVLSSSLAYRAGVASVCGYVDQTDSVRPPQCDLGAYESP